jgi:hypothetical protein
MLFLNIRGRDLKLGFRPIVQKTHAPNSLNEGSSMSDRVHVDSPHFASQVSDALDHFWEVSKLSKHPLTNLRCIAQFLPEGKSATSSLDRGRALHQLLHWAMEEVKTLDYENHSVEARFYPVLQKEYVERAKNQTAAQQLNISESTFYRIRRDALECIAQIIADLERSA